MTDSEFVCASPVIASYVRTLIDHMEDATRNKLLRPLAPQLQGTDGVDDSDAALRCADRAVRVFAPIALNLAGLDDVATKLRLLPTTAAARSAAQAADHAAHAAIHIEAWSEVIDLLKDLIELNK